MQAWEAGGNERRWFSFEGRRRSRSRRRSSSASDSARTVAGGDVVPDTGWPGADQYQEAQEQDIALYSYIVEQQRNALDQQQYVYDAKAEMQLGKKSFGGLSTLVNCFPIITCSYTIHFQMSTTTAAAWIPSLTTRISTMIMTKMTMFLSVCLLIHPGVIEF